MISKNITLLSIALLTFLVSFNFFSIPETELFKQEFSGKNSSGLRAANYNPLTDSLRFTGEVHLRNIKQLTFGGNNAEDID